MVAEAAFVPPHAVHDFVLYEMCDFFAGQRAACGAKTFHDRWDRLVIGGDDGKCEEVEERGLTAKKTRGGKVGVVFAKDRIGVDDTAETEDELQEQYGEEDRRLLIR